MLALCTALVCAAARGAGGQQPKKDPGAADDIAALRSEVKRLTELVEAQSGRIKQLESSNAAANMKLELLTKSIRTLEDSRFAVIPVVITVNPSAHRPKVPVVNRGTIITLPELFFAVDPAQTELPTVLCDIYGDPYRFGKEVLDVSVRVSGQKHFDRVLDHFHPQVTNANQVQFTAKPTKKGTGSFDAVIVVRYTYTQDRELVYAQKTGKLTLDGKEIGKGYSGKGEGLNNPDKDKEKNVGPIPAGVYKVGKPREYKGMPNCFDLTPDGHDAHGRTEFLIHGDNKKMDNSASEGCIILAPELRKQIAETGVTKLKVVKE